MLKASIAHLWFVIHPFEDGNGRIARALTDMLLARPTKAVSDFTVVGSNQKRKKTILRHP